MKNKIKKIFKRINNTISNILYIIFNFYKIFKISNMQTYYPESKRKNRLNRIMDNFMWLIKYKNINVFYNLYGLDIIGSDKNKYCDYKFFMKTRNKHNLKLNTYKEKYNYICILRDKLIFENYMNSLNIKTPETIAIIKNGQIYDRFFKETLKFEDLLEDNKELFIKSCSGECADGVYCIASKEKYEELKENFQKGLFIIQKKIIQNSEMNQIYGKTINTIRIVTVRENEEIKILASVLRVGSSHTGNVDNWAVGGLAIPINEDGILTKYGFYKVGFGTKTATHPDSKIEFNGFKIPYYDKIKELVIYIHKNLYGIHSIGFDVAITNDGPIVIEGNDNWEISIMQLKKGLNNEWRRTL